MMLKLIRACTIILLFVVSSSFANNLDLSPFNTQKVNKNLYVMSQSYGESNINFAVVIGKNEAILITTMMKEYAQHVNQLVKNVTDKPINYVFAIDGDYYQYYGSRFFVENGATFVARENLIPNAFDNRVLVSKPYLLNLTTETINAIPTNAHTLDHMIVALDNSDVIFAGDAINFDWIIYSGKNGPEAHLNALVEMLSLASEETRFYPGNWVQKQFGRKKDLQDLIVVYRQFVDTVKKLSSQGLNPGNIAEHVSIHNILKHLTDYPRQKPYLIHYVKDALGQNN